MSQTNYNIADANGLVQDFWSPLVEQELRESSLWMGLLQDPKYTLQKIKGGDTYKIGFINKPSNTIKTIGTDADSFESTVLKNTQKDLKVVKRCVSSYEFEDLAEIMSQIGSEQSDIRQALLADVRQQANDYIKSLISPSTASPDHVLSGVSDFNLAQLSVVRTAAAVAKWNSSGEPWYLLADPTYYSDMLDDTTLASAESMGIGSSPILNGRFVMKRMGFTIIEDDSLDTDNAFAFIPSFLKVIAGEPRFKISDLHSNKQFGYVISVDFPIGGVQLENTRVIRTYNS